MPTFREIEERRQKLIGYRKQGIARKHGRKQPSWRRLQDRLKLHVGYPSPLKTLANWKRSANAGTLAEVGKQHPAMSEAELELARVKCELAEVKMERDLLKKFAAYFAREQR